MAKLRPLSTTELPAQAGYVDTKAAFMRHLLTCTILTLKHAEERLTRDWQDFCGKKGAIRKPKKGQKCKTARPDENALTYEIGDYVVDYLRHLPSTHEFRQIHFSCETHARSSQLAGSHRKRVDLRYETFIPNGPELVIEAKPLRELSDIEHRYLGEEGLGRFLREEEPYTNELIGGLLGYVADSAIAEYQSEARLQTERLVGHELVVDVNLAPWNSSYSSQHSRSNSRPALWMLHLFLRHPNTAPT